MKNIYRDSRQNSRLNLSLYPSLDFFHVVWFRDFSDRHYTLDSEEPVYVLEEAFSAVL